jgi:hypothetical protein
MRWFQGKISAIEIDSNPNGYVLYEHVNKSSDGWANLLLTEKGSKEHWELGWNGERLSNGHATKNLLTHDPSIHRWVLDALKAATRISQ